MACPVVVYLIVDSGVMLGGGIPLGKNIGLFEIILHLVDKSLHRGV